MRLRDLSCNLPRHPRQLAIADGCPPAQLRTDAREEAAARRVLERRRYRDQFVHLVVGQREPERHVGILLC
jgi:hypothetical protein